MQIYMLISWWLFNSSFYKGIRANCVWNTRQFTFCTFINKNIHMHSFIKHLPYRIECMSISGSLLPVRTQYIIYNIYNRTMANFKSSPISIFVLVWSNEIVELIQTNTDVWFGDFISKNFQCLLIVYLCSRSIHFNEFLNLAKTLKYQLLSLKCWHKLFIIFHLLFSTRLSLSFPFFQCYQTPVT